MENTTYANPNKDNLKFLSEESMKLNILPYYNLSDAEVSQIKFKDTDKQRAVYKISKSERCYCLKKVYFPLPELLFVYSATEWLSAYGIKVPKLLPTLNKGRYVEFKNMLFILTDWIDGRKLDYDNTDDIYKASLNLGKMHKFTKSFEPIKGSSNRYKFENVYQSTKKHFNQLLMSSNLAFQYNDNFSKLFLSQFKYNIELAQFAYDVAATLSEENLSFALCHLDYVNKNLIFDNNNDLWVIDFDKCRIDYCIHDISYFMRRFLKRTDTRWNFTTAIKSLEFYETMHPLTLAEYKGLFVYLIFPQRFWKISRDYYKNIKKCNKSSFINMMLDINKNIQYQINFANDFSNYIEKKFNTKIR